MESEPAAPLVFSRVLSNGSKISFYDFGTAALVAETGEAYSAPVLRGRIGTVEAVWDSIAPGKDTPPALRELHERIDRRVAERNSEGMGDISQQRASEDDTSELVDEGASGELVSSGVPILAAPVGCNNGCCDYYWLYNTFWECGSTGWDQDWFLFNYGHTWADINDVVDYRGFACSAIGTSILYVNLGDHHVSLYVPQATWVRHYWVAPANYNPFWGGPWHEENLRSDVNSDADMHLHSYCGAVLAE